MRSIVREYKVPSDYSKAANAAGTGAHHIHTAVDNAAKGTRSLVIMVREVARVRVSHPFCLFVPYVTRELQVDAFPLLAACY